MTLETIETWLAGAGAWALGLRQMLQPMLQGTLVSIELFFVTLLFAVPLALPVALGRMSPWRPLRRVVHAYLLVMRGTPLILQILFV